MWADEKTPRRFGDVKLAGENNNEKCRSVLDLAAGPRQ